VKVYGIVPVFLISEPYGVKSSASRPGCFAFAEGAADVHSIRIGVGPKAGMHGAERSAIRPPPTRRLSIIQSVAGL
jgi:hypothetical protein